MVERFEPHHCAGYSYSIMEPRPKGGWVSYEDYETLYKQLTEQAAVTEALQESLDDMINLFSADNMLLRGTHKNATIEQGRLQLRGAKALEWLAKQEKANDQSREAVELE